MSANINGNITAICNKLTMLSSFKKYLCYSLYMNDIVLKTYTLLVVLYFQKYLNKKKHVIFYLKFSLY